MFFPRNKNDFLELFARKVATKQNIQLLVIGMDEFKGHSIRTMVACFDEAEEDFGNSSKNICAVLACVGRSEVAPQPSP